MCRARKRGGNEARTWHVRDAGLKPAMRLARGAIVLAVYAQARTHVEERINQAAHGLRPEHRCRGLRALVVADGIGQRQLKQRVLFESESSGGQNIVGAVEERPARAHARQQAVRDRTWITVARFIDEWHPGVLPQLDFHRADEVGQFGARVFRAKCVHDCTQPIMSRRLFGPLPLARCSKSLPDLFVVHFFDEPFAGNQVEGFLVCISQDLCDAAIRAPESKRIDDGGLHLRIGVVPRNCGREIETVNAAARGHLVQQHRSGVLRQAFDLLFRVISEDRGPEPRAIAQCLEADLLIFVSDERPDRGKEFGAARREHEADGPIDLYGRMPTRHVSLNRRSDLRPHFFGRAKNHLGGEDGINLKRGDDRLAARGTLVGITARQTLDCKEDRFLPDGEIEDFGFQRLAPGGIVDLGDDPALDRMRGVPFLNCWCWNE
jgi:hypothetical protein